MTNLPFQALHCHSIVSDGELDHEQILDICAQNKTGVVAFTDHDSLAKPEILEKLKTLHHPVKFISGIEISANSLSEVSGTIGDLHITGLFVDPTNIKLREYSVAAKEKRVERVHRLIENVTNLGFEVTFDDVNRYAKGETIQRNHLANAIIEKEKNLKLIDDIAEKLKNDALSSQELASKYEEAIRSTYYQKVFILFLSPDSFISGIYVDYLYKLSLDDAVSLIHEAGGIAFLAHWGMVKKKVTPDILEKLCKEKRVDGLETVYGFWSDDIKRPELTEEMSFLEKLASQYDLARSTTCDFHRATDFAQMINPRNANLAKGTIGMIEKILGKHPSTNLTWSSF